MSSDRQPPAERASQLINSVPSNSFASKTGTIVIGTGLVAAAISQELYVINEEAVVLAGFAILATYIGKVCKLITFSVYFRVCRLISKNISG